MENAPVGSTHDEGRKAHEFYYLPLRPLKTRCQERHTRRAEPTRSGPVRQMPRTWKPSSTKRISPVIPRLQSLAR
jgi:hypothetical protein